MSANLVRGTCSHRGCDAVPADIDRWRRDRAIRHFLSGHDKDLRAWLEGHPCRPEQTARQACWAAQ